MDDSQLAFTTTLWVGHLGLIQSKTATHGFSENKQHWTGKNKEKEYELETNFVNKYQATLSVFVLYQETFHHALQINTELDFTLNETDTFV